MTTVEALKDLYVALGGDLADVQDMSTNVAVLNAISAKYSGASDAVLNPEAVANIAAVADQIGGGSGDSDFSIAQVTINKTFTDSAVIGRAPCIYETTEVHSSIAELYVEAEEEELTLKVILYKGTALISF